jgi:hypothetical protein
LEGSDAQFEAALESAGGRGRKRRAGGSEHPAVKVDTERVEVEKARLKEELGQIQQFHLLYPPQGEKGPFRTARVLSKQTLTQQALVKTLHLDQLSIT